MPGPYHQVDAGAIAFTPSGANGRAQARVVEVAARGDWIRIGGGEVSAAAFQDGAKGIKRRGEAARNRDGGTQALRAREERKARS
jgi:hypothetical protein